jgi:hypothetical protein
MRVMEILPFPRKIDIADLDNFLRTRLNQIVVMWPEQARTEARSETDEKLE